MTTFYCKCMRSLISNQAESGHMALHETKLNCLGCRCVVQNDALILTWTHGPRCHLLGKRRGLIGSLLSQREKKRDKWSLMWQICKATLSQQGTLIYRCYMARFSHFSYWHVALLVVYFMLLSFSLKDAWA
jgi:hypothetical protein